MDIIIPIVLIALSAFYFVSWVRSRRSKNGFREDLTETAIGQLTGETVQRKAPSSSLSGKTHKKTTVTYAYQVDGVIYQCECVVLDRFQAMPASTRVVYQRKHPNISYLPEFEKPDEKGMQLIMVSGGVFFLLMGLLAAFGVI